MRTLLLLIALVGCGGVVSEMVNAPPRTKDACMLPESRSYPALGATDPCPSALLLELQDMIIGSKYKERETPHAAPSFNKAGTVGTLFGDHWEGDAASGFTVASGIGEVAIGSRITRVKFGYNRAGAGTVTMQLIRKPLAGGGTVAVANFADNASAAGDTVHEIVGINHILLAGNLYYLWVNCNAACDAGGGLVTGASLFHDRL